MQINEAIIMAVLLAHALVALWALRRVRKAEAWGTCKRLLARIAALVVPLIGPLLVVFAATRSRRLRATDSGP